MKRSMALTVCTAFLVLLPCPSSAGDAAVLPKGVKTLNIAATRYFTWNKRFDKDGHVQDAASDFNGVLDQQIFPDLAFFEGPPFNIPGANIGNSVVTFDYDYSRVDTTFAYGITDKLSIGVKVPYIWYRNTVTARLDTANANIGKNPAFNPALPPGPANPPLIPIAIGGQALTTDDVQNILGGGLFINGGLAVPGFGFKRIQTWERDGFGDIESGLKYQYYKGADWQLAALGGVLFPTGKVDDPDNLVDKSLGSGAYALVFRSHNDYTGIRNLVLDVSAHYTLTLPQERDRRIVSDPHQPLTGRKEKVRTDSGDVLEFEGSARYRFDDVPSLLGTSAELLYHYTKYFKDTAKGQGGQRLPSLEEESDGIEQYVIARLAYSTVPLYLKKRFPVPMDASLAYRNKFAGTNNAFKTQYLQLSLAFYF